MVNKKVLVWMHNGPYPYFHYSIALELSKLNDYDFYGFVETKKDMEFFENQQKLKFKELHYFSEKYFDESVPNMAYLSNLEKKYKLNFWSLIYSERWFSEERNFFHTFSSNEILNIIESLSRFYLDFLNRIKPDFILMQSAGESITNFLLYHISKSIGIKTLMLMDTHIQNSFVLSDDIFLNELKTEFKKIKQNPSKKINYYDIDYIKDRELLKSAITLMSAQSQNTTKFKNKLERYFQQIFESRESLFYNRGKTSSKMLKWRINSSSQLKKRESFINKFTIKSIPTEKFIYYPLAVQPESSTSIRAPYHLNQISIIQNIAKSIPVDYILCVKEHPAQKSKNWRPIEFYDSILSLPNVKLIHPSVKNFDMLKNCKLVTLINATTGLEALFFKKPVIVFADVFYDVVSMVKKISNFYDLPDAIFESLNSFIFNPEELSFLIDAMDNKNIVIPYWDIMSEAITISSKRIHSSIEETEKEFTTFFNRNQESFKIIAEKYNNFTIDN